jgi:hypothetical protein
LRCSSPAVQEYSRQAARPDLSVLRAPSLRVRALQEKRQAWLTEHSPVRATRYSAMQQEYFRQAAQCRARLTEAWRRCSRRAASHPAARRFWSREQAAGLLLPLFPDRRTRNTKSQRQQQRLPQSARCALWATPARLVSASKLLRYGKQKSHALMITEF